MKFMGKILGCTGMMRLRKCTVYSKASLFSALLRCFCNCLLAYHLYSLASQLQKPPCTAKKSCAYGLRITKIIKIKRQQYFCSVEIDMDEFLECTKRGERSSTKLYNQEFVQGTRVCRNDCCLLLFAI